MKKITVAFVLLISLLILNIFFLFYLRNTYKENGISDIFSSDMKGSCSNGCIMAVVYERNFSSTVVNLEDLENTSYNKCVSWCSEWSKKFQ